MRGEDGDALIVALKPFFPEEKAQGKNGAERRLCCLAGIEVRLYHPVGTAACSWGHPYSFPALHWAALFAGLL